MLHFVEIGHASARSAGHHALRVAISRALVAIALLVVVMSFQPLAQAVTLKTGDIVITAAMNAFDSDNSALLQIDPVTGNRSIISDATHGDGPMFQVDSNGGIPSGISRVDDGRFLVAARNGIFYIDPANGDRTQVSAAPATSAIAVENQIFAVDLSNLLRIDAATGVPTTLTSAHKATSILPWDGGLLVGGIELLARFELDGTLIHEYRSGRWIFSMAPYGDHAIFAGGINLAEIVDSSNLSSPIGSSFTPLTSPIFGIGVGADGMAWVAVTAKGSPEPHNAIIGFDPRWDGDPFLNPMTILSDATHGSGPAFYAPAGLFVVPEPSAIVLAAFGLIALVGCRVCVNARERAPSCTLSTWPIAALIVASVLSVQPLAQAVTLKSGDIVITAQMSGSFSGEVPSALLRVDPVTGDRTIISDATHGAGPMFHVASVDAARPSGISRVDDGRFLVAAENGIFYVDPSSGDRSQVSTTKATSAVALGKQIFAVDGSQLMRIDPATAASTTLAAASWGFALLPWDGGLVVAGLELLSRYKLDGTLVQRYPSGLYALSMAPYVDNTLITGGINGAAVVDFHYTSFPIGRTYLGPITAPNVGIGIGADGAIWLAIAGENGEVQKNAIVGFDPRWDGPRGENPLTILSDATHGSGPAFYAPTGLYVVPEPSAIVLAAFGLLALAGFSAHCR